MEADTEISFYDMLDAVRERWRVFFWGLICAAIIIGAVWTLVPARKGIQYTLTAPPDGAVVFSSQLIMDQLKLRLDQEAIEYRDARGNLIVKIDDAHTTARLLSIVMTLTADTIAVAREAATNSKFECGDICTRLDAWVRAHDEGDFEMIVIHSGAFQDDPRPHISFVVLLTSLLIAFVLALIATTAEKRRKSIA